MATSETPAFSRSNPFAWPRVNYRLSLASILVLSFGSLITVSTVPRAIPSICYAIKQILALASSPARLRTT